MIASPEAYAHALTTAFLADMAATPSLDESVVRGRLGASGLRNIVVRDLRREAAGETGESLFPRMRAFFRATVNIGEARRRAGLGQWAELAQMASSLAVVAGNYVTAKTTTSTAESLAKMELQKQQLALQAAQIQANTARLQYAQAEAAAGPTGAVTTAITKASEAMGLPGWGLPALAGGVAVLGIGYIILRKRR